VVRRVFGSALFGLGLALLILAVLLPTVVVNGSKKTPLDLNITIHSTGPAKVLDASTGTTKDVQLRATRVVRSDSHASDSKYTTVVETLCIVIVSGNTPDCVTSSDPRLLSATTDRVTVDRKSAEAVHVAKYNENVDGDTSVRHSGMAYKFPIDTKKQTYQFYNPDVKKAVPATYAGESKIGGLKVYKFVSVTPKQDYTIQGVFPGSYVDTRTVYVEPRTGAILKGVEDQTQTLQSGDLALQTTLTFDQAGIDSQVKYAKNKIDQLNLAEIWGPIICGVLGLILLVTGIWMVFGTGRRREDDGGEPAPVYADSSQT
jgi:hypothetical protein